MSLSVPGETTKAAPMAIIRRASATLRTVPAPSSASGYRSMSRSSAGAPAGVRRVISAAGRPAPLKRGEEVVRLPGVVQLDDGNDAVAS